VLRYLFSSVPRSPDAKHTASLQPVSLRGNSDGKAVTQFRAERCSFCVHSFISAFPLDVYPWSSLPLLCGRRVELYDFGSFQNWKRKKKESLKACGLQVAKFSVYLDVSCEPTMLKNVSEHSHRGAHSLVGHNYLSPLHSFMWSSPTPILWFWWPMVSTKREGFEMWMIWTWIQALAGRTIQAKGPASVDQFPQW